MFLLFLLYVPVIFHHILGVPCLGFPFQSLHLLRKTPVILKSTKGSE